MTDDDGYQELFAHLAGGKRERAKEEPSNGSERRLVGRSSRYPRRGNPKDCEFWWYRQSPDHLWAVVMVFWGMEIMERCGNAASFPIDECPGEWIGPIPPPNSYSPDPNRNNEQSESP